VILTAGIGALAALPALRVGGHYLVVVTLALQVIVIDILRNAQGLTGGPDGISGIPRIVIFGQTLSTPGSFLILSAVVALGTYFVMRMLAVSPFGRALRAMRENELATQSIGKNVVALKLIAFAFSAAAAAVAGSLLAHYIAFVSPQSFSIDETILVLAMIILGGTGNLFGAVVGAFILVLLPELLKFLDLPVGTADLMRNAFYGLMLILILRFRPEGLFPERYRYQLPASAGQHVGDFQLSPVADARSGEVTLAGEKLHKTFGGIVAANGVDLELRSGVVTGLIGPNGAGKTTAFNLLTGFISPTSGRVTLRGRPVTDSRPHRIVHSGIARSFQDLKLFRKMTVLENVLVAFPDQLGDRLMNVYFRPAAVSAQEKANIGRALEILDFVGLRERALEEADNLSYAEEKLLVIARLLATDAQVLLLDEPLSGLDPNTLAQVLPIVRRLARQGRTVCLIEHNLDVIREVCDTAVYLDGGRVLAAGKPEDLMKDPQLVERYIQ
jgi:ABC-type branched-subunit amino acid transport system ATPase component/ABC-type branched-subunit amino acid transport system permease subunit